MSLGVVDCRAEHLSALQVFMARVYGASYILRACEPLLRWQFGGVSSGQSDTFHLKLAMLDGEVVGCLGYIPVDVTIAGRVARGAWLANWMVDPDKRRLGLGPLLMREVTNQFDVTLNLGPNQDARTVLVKMGWTDVGPLPRYVHVLDRDAAARLTESGRLDWPATEAPPTPASAIDVQPVKVFTPEATKLWDQLAWTLGSGTRRSAEYLNWRYARHPLWGYRCFEAREGARPAGFAVYHVESVRDLPVKVGRLVELVGTSPTIAALVGATLEDAREEDVALIDFFCSSPLMAEPLRAKGFLSGHDAPVVQLPMLFQPVDRRRTAIPFLAYLAKAPAGASVGHWHVTKGDGDQDRPN
jgi:GNAT superfamily N-acetyltransferase